MAQRIGTLTPLLVSVVDDDVSLRLALVALLNAYGFEAEAYVSAEDFLSRANISAIACLITDVQMPGLSGIELKKRIDSIYPALPIIMITARTERVLLDRVEASAPFRMLHKPVDAEELMQAVDEAIALRTGG